MRKINDPHLTNLSPYQGLARLFRILVAKQGPVVS
jgi:hypothetical protein